MAQLDICKNYNSVLQRIDAVCKKNNRDKKPRLVAASKTKSKEMIMAVYNEGQRHFGENYIQELVEKSTDPEVLKKCDEIKWHFIGHLQRNKINKLVSVPRLHIVETVDSEKVATALNSAWEKLKKTEPLKVMVQVNSSCEEAKGGCEPDYCCTLVDYILKDCPHLKFIGLMTIGIYDYNPSSGPNPDFLCLSKCRDDVCKKLGLNIADVELSMGMSTDFEQAIELGSTNVRVGTTIFGPRVKKTESTNISNETENPSLK